MLAERVSSVASAFVAQIKAAIISASISNNGGSGAGQKDLYSASPLKFLTYSPALPIKDTSKSK